MTDGGGYDNSSVGYPRGEDEEGEERRREQRREEKEEEEEERRGRRSAKGPKAERERENGGHGKAEGGGKEDVCPLAMIIAESHRTWKDRKNDSPSAVFSFTIARRRERAS